MTSRRQKHKRSSRGPLLVEQEKPQEQRAQRVPNIRPGGTNFKPINDAVINSMYQHFGPQSHTDSLYSPGAPLRPIPGLLPPEGPRGFDYSIGYNIAQLPRSEEQYSFADLRAMAGMYYGVQMCQQVWFDYISKLELVVEPRKELLAENMDTSMYADDIQFYQDFFAYPDKDHDFHSWLQKAVRDQLEIDAVSIFVRKDRIGRPYSLDLLDSALIKPLITDRGRTPEPPYPAYEQFVHGVPAAFLTTDDLIYIKETERSDSVYGRSRVEKIMLYVTMALRKQTKDLARFTDGTLPQGFIIPSMDVQWSQEEIEEFELQLNNLMAGNDELRARLKVLPRGFSFETTQDADIHMDLDEFILNVCAAGHGITMSELAFTADVNRATGEMQENVVYRRAMGPLMNRYAKLFTLILRKFFNETRFIVKLKGYGEVEDFQSQSTAYATLVGSGIQSPTQAAHALNLPVYGNVDVPPFIVTKTGPIMVDDLADPEVRAASKAAFIAGASGQPAGKQGQTPDDGSESEEEDEDGTQEGNQQQGKQQPKTGQKEDKDQALSRVSAALERIEEQMRLLRARNVTPEDPAPVDGSLVSRQGTCPCPTCRGNHGKSISTIGRMPPYHAGCDCAALPQGLQRSNPMGGKQTEEDSYVQRAPSNPETAPRYGTGSERTPEPDESTGARAEGARTGASGADPKARAAEFRRWRTRATDDIKAGRAVRPFESSLIPRVVQALVVSGLQACKTPEDVRTLFEMVREDEAQERERDSSPAGPPAQQPDGRKTNGGGFLCPEGTEQSRNCAAIWHRK